MKNLLLLTTLFFVMVSCSDQSDKCPKAIGIPSDLNPLKFSTGSYWIYQNTKGQTDSVYITSTEEGIYENPPSVHGLCATKHAYYKIKLKSSFTNEDLTYLIDNIGFRKNTATEWEICGFMLIPKDSDYLDRSHLSFQQTFHTQFSTFNNVSRVENFFKPNGSCYSTDSFVYYANRDVGIIKIEKVNVTDPETWDLKFWNLK